MDEEWGDFNMQPMDAGAGGAGAAGGLGGAPSFAPSIDPSAPQDAASPTGAAFSEFNMQPVSEFNKEAFAAKFTGPLAQKADVIEQKSQQYGVPPALASAIIAQETGYGKAIRGNNVGGMMQGGGSQKMQFGSLDDGIDKAIANIAKQYERSGRSLEGMRDIYAPLGAKNDPKGLNKDWLPGVSKIMEGLGGHDQRSDIGPSTRVADAGGEVHPIEIETLLGQHAQGKITNKELRDSLPSGWQIDLRGKYGPYKLWSPSGREHFIHGQADTDGQVS